MRTRLAARRFPDVIIRYRTGRGRYVLGEWVEGVEESIELAASVQPLSLEDSDFAGGSMTRARLKVYVPQSADPDASPLTPILQAAFAKSTADEVLWAGQRFTVEESRRWPKFTRATLLRET